MCSERYLSSSCSLCTKCGGGSASRSSTSWIDLVTALSNAHRKVIWLNVSMYEVVGVDILDARNLSQRVSEE